MTESTPLVRTASDSIMNMPEASENSSFLTSLNGFTSILQDRLRVQDDNTTANNDDDDDDGDENEPPAPAIEEDEMEMEIRIMLTQSQPIILPLLILFLYFLFEHFAGLLLFSGGTAAVFGLNKQLRNQIAFQAKERTTWKLVLLFLTSIICASGYGFLLYLIQRHVMKAISGEAPWTVHNVLYTAMLNGKKMKMRESICNKEC